MQNRDQQGEGNPGNQTSSQNKRQGSRNSSDSCRLSLSQKFSQKHGLNQQQSDDAADSWLGSVKWASKQKKDDDFNDFVNPKTQSSKNSLYNGWQSEYNTRLRQNGFEENQAKKLSSEEPDSYFQELSSADENWYSDFGNDGRDVSNDGSSSRNDRSSTASDENSDSSDAEGSTSRRRRTEEEELAAR